ncbi:MAG: hypothetical protein GF401_12120 [Chitinivibrionales bacterium]|nr:hypothetical protein [Chitinivibrionales bacterium]
MSTKAITTAKKQFTAYLKEKGCLCTSQRKSILEEIFKNHSHFSIEELTANLRKKKTPVSRATIYRTIGHLENGGFVRRINLDQSYSYYEFIPGTTHHEHMVCEECGTVLEITDKAMEERICTLAQKKHFLMTRHQLQIYGLCPHCQKKHKEKIAP